MKEMDNARLKNPIILMSLIFGTREIYATKDKEDPQPKYHPKYPTGMRYAYIECPISSHFTHSISFQRNLNPPYNMICFNETLLSVLEKLRFTKMFYLPCVQT